MLLGILALVLVALAVLLFTPKSCQISDGSIKVKTWLLTLNFPLRDATGVVAVVRSEVSGLTTVRVFGIGWPLKSVGWFRSPALGTFLNLANDQQNMCLVSFPKRQLVVSPAGGIQEIQSQLARATP